LLPPHTGQHALTLLAISLLSHYADAIYTPLAADLALLRCRRVYFFCHDMPLILPPRCHSRHAMLRCCIIDDVDAVTLRRIYRRRHICCCGYARPLFTLLPFSAMIRATLDATAAAISAATLFYAIMARQLCQTYWLLRCFVAIIFAMRYAELRLR